MNFQEYYQKTVIPEMKKKFGYTNNLVVPRITKVVVNVGLGTQCRDEKFRDAVTQTLQTITGQKPILTRARQAIAGFGIREGLVIGEKVTLRGSRMYDFLTKLIYTALPRVRDFQGIPANSLDKQGNLTIGFKEQTVFPEIDPEKISALHGLEVVMVTTARTRKEARELFALLKIPFKNG